MISFESSKLAVEFECGLTVGCVSFFRSLEIPQISRGFVYSYAGKPFFILLVPRDALKSRCIVKSLFGVNCILHVGGWAEFSPAIVRSYPAPVINLKLRPLARHIKPSQSVGHKPIFRYDDSYISILVQAPGYLPDQSSAGCWTHVQSFAPSKYARGWIVIQNRPYELRGQPLADISVFRNVLLSQVTLLKSWWSGFSEGVFSAFRNPNYTLTDAGGQI